MRKITAHYGLGIALLLHALLLFAGWYFLLRPVSETEPADFSGHLPLIIDADTANEVDDLFALVGALAHTRDHDEYQLVGITSAQFHTSPLASPSTALESQRINEDLIRLTGRTEVDLPVGSNLPLMNDSVPAVSPASTFIVEQAKSIRDGDKLQLFILGSCTNAASAILQDPTIIPKLHVRYLGFWHDPATNVFDKKEFNSGNDTFAVNVLLNTPGLEFTVMTATTSQHLTFKRDSVDRALAQTGALGDYLLNRWETYDRWWTTEDPDKTSWIMWDVALIEAFFRPDLATIEQRQTPMGNLARNIGVYTDLERFQMEAQYWEVVKSLPSSSR